jgi:hypothetical protein
MRDEHGKLFFSNDDDFSLFRIWECDWKVFLRLLRITFSGINDLEKLTKTMAHLPSPSDISGGEISRKKRTRYSEINKFTALFVSP